MASSDRRHMIESDGFFSEDDANIGKQVDSMIQKGYPFPSVEGLDFLKRNTIEDERVRETIESLFSWAGIGAYKIMGADPKKRIFCSIQNERDEPYPFEALNVYYWSTGSEVVFYKRSHRYPMHAKDASHGIKWLEVPYESLSVNDIEPEERTLGSGGL
ncbi:MAG: hypothetical protein M4579_005231 [Chaenotheca gracillima]|nr:MAG: hypothetical protein M4579_005231 [Chaenotheca gracillima]